MGKDIRYKLEKESALTGEEISLIKEAKELKPEYDEDNPVIDPVSTPELYKALMNAVADRNRNLTGVTAAHYSIRYNGDVSF